MLRAIGIEDATLGRLTVGQRDTLLMDLRGRVFGAWIASVADCPACSERMDVAFDLRDIWAPPSGDPVEPIEIEAGGYRVQARPPIVDDLIWLDRCDPSVDRRSILLERCVLGARRKGRSIRAGALPPAVVSDISTALANADPRAEIQLALSCTACGHSWSALFDIVSYFWQELESWVWRMARDVDTLAARYGWTETEILAMSPDRRALYLDLVRG
jgi:hypothetical protein